MQPHGSATKVYEKLKKRIILLEYQPGQILPVKKIAQEFGTSTTPVREALIRLDAEGLVRLVPNSSAYVSEVSFQGLKDALEVRLVLIEKVGELAARRVKESDLEALKKLIDKLKETKVKTRHILIGLDTEFHELLNRAAGNKMLAKMLAFLRNQLIRLWFFIENQEEYLQHLMEDYKEVLDALKNRDGKRCAEILRMHVLDFADRVRDEFLLRGTQDQKSVLRR